MTTFDALPTIDEPDEPYNGEEHCTQGCGRRNIINALQLGRPGAELMIRLHRDFGGQADQPTMDLKGADYATISRTRYWGLTDQPEGTRKGTYRITSDGYAFLAGDLLIPHTLHQFDKRIIGRSGPLVGIRDLLREEYQTYEEIIAEVRAMQRIADRVLLDENIARHLPPAGGLRNFEDDQ